MTVQNMFNIPAHEFSVTTPRVTLRLPRVCDMASWIHTRTHSYNYLQQWEPMWANDHLTSAGFMMQHDFAHAQYNDKKMLILLIIDNATQKVIGGCEAVRFMDWPIQSAMAGYWIAQAVRGRGYMPEALHAMCNMLHYVAGLHRVEAAVLSTNTASQRVLQKVGFVREGMMREFAEINGKWCDHDYYGLVLSQLPAFPHASAPHHTLMQEVLHQPTDATAPRF